MGYVESKEYRVDIQQRPINESERLLPLLRLVFDYFGKWSYLDTYEGVMGRSIVNAIDVATRLNADYRKSMPGNSIMRARVVHTTD